MKSLVASDSEYDDENSKATIQLNVDIVTEDDEFENADDETDT